MVDEADRLLRQAYQDWLPHVIAALEGDRNPLGLGSSANHTNLLQFSDIFKPVLSSDTPGRLWDGDTPFPAGTATSAGHLAGSGIRSAGPWASSRRVVKIVVSATLTRDPAKLDHLALHCPRYLALAARDNRLRFCALPSHL